MRLIIKREEACCASSLLSTYSWVGEYSVLACRIGFFGGCTTLPVQAVIGIPCQSRGRDPPSPLSVNFVRPSGSRSVEKRMSKNRKLRFCVSFTPEIAQLHLGDFAFNTLIWHCTLLILVGQAIFCPSWKTLALGTRMSFMSIGQV